MASAQLPLAARAIVTSRSRPARSATSPPHTQPSPPTAMVPKAARETAAGEAVRRDAALAARKTGIQVQKE